MKKLFLSALAIIFAFVNLPADQNGTEVIALEIAKDGGKRREGRGGRSERRAEGKAHSNPPRSPSMSRSQRRSSRQAQRTQASGPRAARPAQPTRQSQAQPRGRTGHSERVASRQARRQAREPFNFSSRPERRQRSRRSEPSAPQSSISDRFRSTPRSPSMTSFERPRGERRRDWRGGRERRTTPRNRERIRDQVRQFERRKNRPKRDDPENRRRSDRFKSSRKERRDRDKRRSEHVSSRVKGHHRDYHKWFDHSFFDHHHYHPDYYYDPYWYEDRYIPYWPVINNWLGWGQAYPIYYDAYGAPTEIYIDSGADLQPVESTSSNLEWMPLGVFALGSDPDKAATSNEFLQLALNKQGDIGGTYYNASTDKLQSLEGTVEEESQATYWRLKGNETAPFMSTGLYNLTEEVVPIQINYADGRTEDWTLIRIE